MLFLAKAWTMMEALILWDNVSSNAAIALVKQAAMVLITKVSRCCGTQRTRR